MLTNFVPERDVRGASVRFENNRLFARHARVEGVAAASPKLDYSLIEVELPPWFSAPPLALAPLDTGLGAHTAIAGDGLVVDVGRARRQQGNGQRRRSRLHFNPRLAGHTPAWRYPFELPGSGEIAGAALLARDGRFGGAVEALAWRRGERRDTLAVPVPLILDDIATQLRVGKIRPSVRPAVSELLAATGLSAGDHESEPPAMQVALRSEPLLAVHGEVGEPYRRQMQTPQRERASATAQLVKSRGPQGAGGDLEAYRGSGSAVLVDVQREGRREIGLALTAGHTHPRDRRDAPTLLFYDGDGRHVLAPIEEVLAGSAELDYSLVAFELPRELSQVRPAPIAVRYLLPAERVYGVGFGSLAELSQADPRGLERSVPIEERALLDAAIRDGWTVQLFQRGREIDGGRRVVRGFDDRTEIPSNSLDLVSVGGFSGSGVFSEHDDRLLGIRWGRDTRDYRSFMLPTVEIVEDLRARIGALRGPARARVERFLARIGRSDAPKLPPPPPPPPPRGRFPR